MTASSQATNVVLVSAVTLPAVGALVPALMLLEPGAARRGARAAMIAATATWFGLVVSSRHPHVGPVGADALVAAAGVGTGLLALAVPGSSPRIGSATGVAMTALTASLATESGGVPSAVGGLAGLVAVVALIGLMRQPGGRGRAIAASPGLAAIAGGVLQLHERSGRWALVGGSGLAPAALIGGGAAAVVVALAADGLFWRRNTPPDVVSLRQNDAMAMAMVPVAAGLALGVRALVLIAGVPGAGGLAIGLALAATGLAAAGARWRLEHSAAAVLVVWAFAATVSLPSGAGRGPGLLLAAAAVLVAVAGTRVLASAIPGGITLAVALGVSTGGRPAVIGAALAVSAVCLARPAFAGSGVERTPASIAGVGLAVWLVLAPATWGWTGASDLGPYTDGTPIAVAAAGVAMVAVTAWRARPATGRARARS